MRCKQCDYRLWNLTSRHCPECSVTYTPSDYHFKRGAVEFCCPHCSKVYYGTNEHGQLEPVDFDCTQCGKHIHMNDMLLRPVNPAEEAFIASKPNPWTVRPRRKNFITLLRTIQMSQYQPHLLMDGTPTKGGSLDALIFASSLVVFICFVGYGLPVMLLSAMLQNDSDKLPFLVQNLLIVLAAIASILSVLFVTSAVTHALLKITGGTRHDLSCTFKALAYAAGPLMWLGFPICNSVFIFVVVPWYYIGTSIAVVRMQHVNAGRAMVCLLVVPVIVLFFLLRYLIFS